MIKYILLTASVAIVAGLGVVIDAQSRSPVEHPTAPIEPRWIYARGRVEGVTPEIELRPQLSGRILELLVQEGETVEAGAVLLQLDDQQYRCEVELAGAELELATAERERLVNGAHPKEREQAESLYEAKVAELEQAQLTWQRIERLSQARAISQQEADNQRTLVQSLQAEVEAARAHWDRVKADARDDEIRMAQAKINAAAARLELAKVQLERTRLRAPCRGQILKIELELGELAGPDSAEPVVIMADVSQMQVRAFVEELDAPRVAVGMPARITADGLPGMELAGCVARMSPRMSRKELWSDEPTERYDTKTREVWISLDSGAGLVVGLQVEVVIDGATIEENGEQNECQVP
ncbi:MAG: HlyD family secretion protein [Planctomycetota bacterium]